MNTLSYLVYTSIMSLVIFTYTQPCKKITKGRLFFVSLKFLSVDIWFTYKTKIQVKYNRTNHHYLQHCIMYQEYFYGRITIGKKNNATRAPRLARNTRNS